MGWTETLQGSCLTHTQYSLVTKNVKLTIKRNFLEIIHYNIINIKKYTIMETNNIFDIDKIPILLLDKSYFDYEEYYETFDIHSLSESNIYENEKIDVIYSSHDIINDLMNTYNISTFQIKTKNTNSVDYIEAKMALDELPNYISLRESLLIPDINDNTNIITEFLDDHGYYLANSKVSTDKRGRRWYVMIFDPKKQESIKEQVLKYHDIAYHTTPSSNAESIEENGIIARVSFKPYKTISNRVYLYLGRPVNPKYVQMMRDISSRLHSENKLFTGDFTEFEIDLSKLPDSDFFYDVHGYNKDFIYTTSNIPVDAINKEIDKEY